MYLKKLKKIFCGFLTAFIAFGFVGANQAFCVPAAGPHEVEFINAALKGDESAVQSYLDKAKDTHLVVNAVSTGTKSILKSDGRWSTEEVQLNVIERLANVDVKREKMSRELDDKSVEKMLSCANLILAYCVKNNIEMVVNHGNRSTKDQYMRWLWDYGLEDIYSFWEWNREHPDPGLWDR